MPMHNRQGSPQEEQPGMTPARDGRRVADVSEGDPHASEERLLAEVRHELGNFLHKLYYWAEFMKEGAARGVDSTASEMLERTISDFESFLEVTLDYFSPVRLNLLRLPVRQLLGSLRGVAGCDPTADADPAFERVGVDDATILVDPTYISKAFAITAACMRGQCAEPAKLQVSVRAAQREGFPGFEVAISASHANPSPALLRPPSAGVQWAVARKLFEMHGGEMIEEKEDRGQVRAVRVFLPAYR